MHAWVDTHTGSAGVPPASGVSRMCAWVDIVLIKEQLRRYWVIGAIGCLFYIFILLSLWSNSGGSQWRFYDIITLQNGWLIAGNIILPFLAAYLMFSYIFRPAQVIAAHTLPFSRKKLFVSNLLAGWLLIILPLLLLAVFLAFPIRLGAGDYLGLRLSNYPVQLYPRGVFPGDLINPAHIIIGFFLRAVISFTFYYAIFVSAVVLSGNTFVSLCFSGIFSVGAVVIWYLALVLSRYYIFGYYYNIDMPRIALYTIPFLATEEYTFGRAGETPTVASSIAPYYIAYTLIAAAVITAAYWLYKKRPLERTGDAVVFTPVKHFFIFILSVAGMAIIGAVAVGVTGGGAAALYTGFVIGFILGHYIALAITEKAFNVFRNMKGIIWYAAAVIAVAVVFTLINALDLTGYVNRVPRLPDIQAVYFGDPYDIKRLMNSETDRARLNGEPEIIEKTTAVHREIIANRNSLRSVFTRYAIGGGYYSSYSYYYDDYDYYLKRLSERPYHTQHITYILNNGNTLSREYVLTNDVFEKSGMRDLLEQDDVIIARHAHWLKIPGSVDLLFITLPPEVLYTGGYEYLDVDGEKRILTISDKTRIYGLTQAIREDFLMEYRITAELGSEWRWGAMNEIGIRYDTGSGRYGNTYLYYSENTMRWLRENGFVR